MSKKVNIVGAGLVGSLLSIYLAKRGYKVNIFERRADMRKIKMSAGKSINLALSDRGWRGLEGVGIADEIRKIAIPMYGRHIHNRDGSTAFQPYGKNNQAIYSVSRAEINMRLMDLAEQQPNVKIYFDERCTDVNKQTNTSTFENNTTKKITTDQSDLVFGADGAFAASRLNMQLTRSLSTGKHVIAFMSASCPHCRIAAKKLRIMMEKNPSLPIYLVLNGEDDKFKLFFEDTKATNIPYCRLNGKNFVYLAGLNMPMIYLVNNSVAETNVDYIHLDQNEIEKWLGEK